MALTELQSSARALPINLFETGSMPQGGRRSAEGASVPAAAKRRRPRTGAGDSATDRFFRHLVSCMRNGVLAIGRDGTLLFMNESAYRTFNLTPGAGDIGRPFTDVLRSQPEVVRILASVFDLGHLPNRAELRLKSETSADVQPVTAATVTPKRLDNAISPQ